MNTKIILIAVLISGALATNYRYTLAQEWPGAVCKHQNCNTRDLLNYDGSGWNMHGLWPDKYNVDSCESIFNCSPETYNPSVISEGTLNRMDQVWVGLYNSVTDFRNHEWTKHGTCWQGKPLSESVNSQQESYFRTVLALRESYNLYKVLSNEGIHPHNSRTYSYAQVLGAVKVAMQQASGGNYVSEDMVQLICAYDQQSGHAMIEQVYICLDDNYRPANCNCKNSVLTAGRNCHDQILYPEFSRV